MDSFFVRMEDPKEIKVGVPTVFWGECGLGIAGITLMVDGFEIGKAIFIETADFLKLGYRTWKLMYTFKGAGKARALQILANDSKGSASFVCIRKQDLKVEAANEEVKPEGKTKFPVTIVESKVRHVTRGDMELEGLCVHHTAGRQTNDPTGTINMANSPDHSAYGYWVISSDGIVTKTHETNRWAYHCGTYHHKTYLGIEIMGAGLLTERNGKLYPWFDFKNDVPRERARYFEGGKQQIKGWYWPFTKAQEDALVGLIQFLKDTEPKFKLENVKGHDEICFEAGYPGAKNDPGGSLSMSMPEFREYLKTVIV